MKILYGIVLLFLIHDASCDSVWHWTCDEPRQACQKNILTDDVPNPLSLSQCELLCVGSGGIWPKPTSISLGTTFAQVAENLISFSGVDPSAPISSLVESAINIFEEQLPTYLRFYGTVRDAVPINVVLNIEDVGLTRLDLNTIENYTLSIAGDCSTNVAVSISANNFFGARHGLETLNQLIILDELRNQLVIPCGVEVVDGPVYKWRGVLLDTARNYATLDAIKTTLNAMGAAKLNVFHWHLTDSQSFPFVSESRPELSQYGAYSPDKIYTKEIVQAVVDYGLSRGVRVIPEIDAPAHVGEGWQNTNLVTCFKWQPWESFCAEPPCGQFDPTKDELYDYLSDIYKDLINQINPDVFHMGGDEVNFNCWRSTPEIVEWMVAQGWGVTDEDFLKLWAYFQSKALEKLDAQTETQLPVILWSSTLTSSPTVTDILSPDRYIIQAWTTKYDPQIPELLEKGYRVILSNYDALYMDCGFGNFVGDGVNWCSPFSPWTTVYENKPYVFLFQNQENVIGAETTLFSELVDSTTIDNRLWPRTSAMAEVFWSAPATYWRDANNRFLVHRERLVRLGVQADAVQPEWCKQNQDQCVLTW